MTLTFTLRTMIISGLPIQFEPTRKISIGNCIAAEGTGLLYVPLGNTVVPKIVDWLTRLSPEQNLITDFSQKTLKEWLASNVGARRFTVLEHPLVRAYNAFCRHILLETQGSFPRFRNRLAKDYGVVLPKTADDLHARADADVRELFKTFLTFLKANIQGQTPLRIDPSWASQHTFFTNLSNLIVPDIIFREDELGTGLIDLARRMGIATVPALNANVGTPDIPLDRIVDADINEKIAAIYARDYQSFGFSDWRA